MENKDALLEYIAQQEQIRNDFNKKLAIEELNAISGTAFGDTLKGLAGIREKLKTAPRDQGKEIFPIDMLLIVLLLARITGCNTAQSISQYCKDNSCSPNEWKTKSLSNSLNIRLLELKALGLRFCLKQGIVPTFTKRRLMMRRLKRQKTPCLIIIFRKISLNLKMLMLLLRKHSWTA